MSDFDCFQPANGVGLKLSWLGATKARATHINNKILKIILKQQMRAHK